MILIKNFIKTLFFLGLLIFTFFYRTEIVSFIYSNIIYKKEIILESPNKYKLDYNFKYVKETDNFFPKNKNDLISIFYTALNSGWKELTFFCDTNYKNCLKDIEDLSSNSEFLSMLNNFVHPFNSFSTINTNLNSLGKAKLTINYLYTKEEIVSLEKKVNEIYKSKITSQMKTEDKILIIHDYIINNSKYDEANKNLLKQTDNSNITSHKAIGPLLENKGICSGYSDAMSLFLTKMNLPNYKISNDEHIWNYVFIENTGYHLDLTWDDPVVTTGEDILIHDYFLIGTEELFSLNNNHSFDENVFIEARSTN